MDFLHSTWFWVVVIAAPVATVLATLIRLARREPPPDLPPGVVPQPWRDDEDDVEPTAARGHDGKLPPP